MSRITTQLQNLPPKPGVYLFSDKAGRILYVGKAKNLRKRVSSYFKNRPINTGQPVMLAINRVKNIKTIITDSELEALILESNLIKKHRPRYNVILKDDKNYQYIKIDWAEDFPKLYTVRKPVKDHARYFGPFPSGLAVQQTLKVLRKMFPYRSCNQEIFENKEYRRACLNYHIKQCLGPCIGAVNKKEYRDVIQNCSRFLAGEGRKLVRDLGKEMKTLSGQRNFEQAACLRDQITNLKEVLAKQKVISAKGGDQDYISLKRQDGETLINLFTVRAGQLVDQVNFNLANTAGRKDGDVLASFIPQHYSRDSGIPDEIVVPVKPGNQGLLIRWLGKTKITVPKQGRKLALLKMGITNINADAVLAGTNSRSPQTDIHSALHQLRSRLHLLRHPRRIEAYDISNIQGRMATGSMVVFTNGQPDKKEYRKFRIKTVRGANDTAMIREVLDRRMRHGNWPAPDLIIIDGGKPQLNAARAVLKVYKSKTALAALAKREERLFPNIPGHRGFANLPQPLLHLLQRIRDEAHRFAIGYHLNLRRRESGESVLDSIPGIGPKTKKKLLKKFGSVAGIKKAPRAEIEKICGQEKAQRLKKEL